ncbi:hypothetical protein JAAARDRAFT_130885 [Jaapia argillacea MUCL 33604]|uniref:Helicase ATP-binding domain-containing protein n=1 Tax=Jaapia argillacea MUCL 33604 TaxID=933084 RepID=A0A067PQK2_9AGAM|nr:hypothetical protein JAAARDRAFT_130885 [Jaapia argillacea MUCL 33604]
MSHPRWGSDIQSVVSELTHSVNNIQASGNTMVVTAERYQNRLRVSGADQHVRIKVEGPEGPFTVTGQATSITGRVARITPSIPLEGKEIISISTVGQDDSTHAEASQVTTTLAALSSQDQIQKNPWLQFIYYPNQSINFPPSRKSSQYISYQTSQKSHLSLNSSQTHAVNTMLSNTDNSRITIIQGPPGTGKTSVIAAFTSSALASGRSGIWLVAQSNVAVKNIAEKLVSTDFHDWKLLVSKDFHFDWHEHLYTKIANNIIRSDDFIKPYATMRALLNNCHVVLSTINMLLNPQVLKNIIKHIPISILVVDEASQITLGTYTPIFTKFGGRLQKVCFIGDDKQLPPHSQDSREDPLSIFEVPHLRSSAKLLDTQYRMPPQVGDFISKAVYEGQLNSNPQHPIVNTTSCYFIDVVNGQEMANGDGWMNIEECNTVLQIAHKLQSEDKKYRIITPYSAQRSELENGLKTKNMEWNDKCFTVDSFQGLFSTFAT